MGEQKLFFEDVSEGDAGPEVRHELTRTDLVMYAGASGDFNPMHHDEVKAKAAGLPSVFGHGMFSAGPPREGHHRLRRHRQRAPVTRCASSSRPGLARSS